VLCRLGGSRTGKALTFSRPYWTHAQCRCLSVWSCSGWASFSACVLSPYMYLVVYYLCYLQMPSSLSCPSPAMNRYVCLFPSLPFLLFETLEVWRRGMVVPDLLPMVSIRWLVIACLYELSLSRCRLGMLLPLLCTCHTFFCHCKNYCVVSLLFWVLVFCCAKD
jgi:hypothetical protein